MEDSGHGVLEAERQRLLERFHAQGSSQGAGLGLSIVQRITERHRGRLTLAESPLGGLLVRVEWSI